MSGDGGFTGRWVRAFARSVTACEPELTALDQLSGDGDFGANLRSGLAVCTAALDGAGRVSPGAPLRVLATAFLDEVGGTSGPLFGLLFQELAAAVDGPEPTARALALGAGRGLAAIRRVGEAAPGDKTLLDALHPAVLALAAAPPSAPAGPALERAADAAWEGVRRTAGLPSRRGRASYLGDRARGVPDPGAAGVAVFLSSARGPVLALAPLLAAPAPPAAPAVRPHRPAGRGLR
ncbi:DAK2 domain-containing protein [Streptomyces sp. NPDC000594]|uniref:DAK2 domain-containing protein n=1 Tax=Streptomyces sp. NPDC000594 TaxID=3154261 RepID=UPI003325DFFA